LAIIVKVFVVEQSSETTKKSSESLTEAGCAWRTDSSCWRKISYKL